MFLNNLKLKTQRNFVNKTLQRTKPLQIETIIRKTLFALHNLLNELLGNKIVLTKIIDQINPFKTTFDQINNNRRQSLKILLFNSIFKPIDSKLIHFSFHLKTLQKLNLINFLLIQGKSL